MSIEWYRAYHGLPYDPKLQVIAKRTGQPMAYVLAVWMCLLDAASRHEPRGIASVDAEEVAVMQGIELDAVSTIIKAFHDKGMIDKKNQITSWNKRQHSSVNERVKKHRERKKENMSENNAKNDVTKCNAVKRQETKNNGLQRKNAKIATDTDTDTDTDLDKERDTDQEKRGREEKGECEREKHKIEESEKKSDANSNKNSEAKPDLKISRRDAERKIIEQMLEIWNEEVQSKITRGRKAMLTPRRKELLLQRWHEEFHEDIQAWQYFCEIIGQSDFCLGRIKGKDWTIDLGWAIENSERIAKILEGGFSGGSHPAEQGKCHIPELQEHWQKVKSNFAGRYGISTAKSWLSGLQVVGASQTDDGVCIHLLCQNNFVKKWLEQHYLDNLSRWWCLGFFNDQPITEIKLLAPQEQL